MFSLDLLFAQFEQAEREGLMTPTEVRQQKQSLLALKKLVNKRRERKRNAKSDATAK